MNFTVCLKMYGAEKYVSRIEGGVLLLCMLRCNHVGNKHCNKGNVSRPCVVFDLSDFCMKLHSLCTFLIKLLLINLFRNTRR